MIVIYFNNAKRASPKHSFFPHLYRTYFNGKDVSYYYLMNEWVSVREEGLGYDCPMW